MEEMKNNRFNYTKLQNFLYKNKGEIKNEEHFFQTLGIKLLICKGPVEENKKIIKCQHRNE